MYDYKNAMYEKAEKYFAASNCLKNNGIIDESLLIEIQISIECYLCNILEMINENDCDSIFGNQEIPHDGLKLYRKIYPYGETYHPALPKFNVEFKNLLNGVFRDYNAIRYPKRNNTLKGMRMVDVDDILNDFDLMLEIKDFADRFRERYFELKAEKNIADDIEIDDL